MLKMSGNNPLGIEMVEGDFGLVLPIIIESDSGTIFGSEDEFTIKIFKSINTEPIINKTYSNITNNTIDFELTESESLLLPVGIYYYDLDWYENGVFMCNILAKENYVVLEKAGIVNES